MEFDMGGVFPGASLWSPRHGHLRSLLQASSVTVSPHPYSKQRVFSLVSEYLIRSEAYPKAAVPDDNLSCFAFHKVPSVVLLLRWTFIQKWNCP